MTSKFVDEPLQHPAFGLLGRLCFTAIFFLSGVTHFTDIDGYVALMPEGTPAPVFWVLVSGVVELLGAVMILFNRYAKLGGWLIVLFLVPVTIVIHGTEMMNAEDATMRAVQLSFFLKGVAMTGGALLITQLGVARKRP